ncbi:hypothetical protein CVT24_005065 [Panaeolus cyanescens]|uniref:Cytochrome P450 n=1 Tax=Panaeolus cyanescens TaxID=181874 RepID=A0A409VPL2_9AGAR|nr:hypothetical protein CVT24_005065 [Panaeolus cyanescens]
MSLAESYLHYVQPHLQTISAVLLCWTMLLYIHHRLNRQKLPLPPGPPGNVFFGNTFPKAYAYRKFEEWTQEYGPIFSLRQGFTTVIVIGRLQAAIDIMEKEGASLVDRPRSIAAGETLSGGMRVLLTPAGERFKKMRRALHAHLQPKIVAGYAPTLMKNARQHILDIIASPDKHQEHAKRHAFHYSSDFASPMCSYGKTPQSYDDPDVVAVNRCLTRLGNNLRPGMWKVDTYPFLRYIPGYLKELQDGHAEELNLFKKQLRDVKIKMDKGEEVPQSFGKYLLERRNELELNEDETAYLAGSMFGAGSDTTASGISIAIMAAACYPETQRKVQEELDAVIGSERAPIPSDADSLPQTMAFVLETFRWRPVTAGGAPHKTTKDIIWQNYLIPKGATVIGNVWAVGRDPEYFPNPEKFDPQRWINKDGKLRDDIKSYPFGFGRRVCPGSHMATSSIFLNTALVF